MSDSPPSGPESWAKSATWPSWSTLLRRLGRDSWVSPATASGDSAESAPRENNDWFQPLHATSGPLEPTEGASGSEVLPGVPNARFKIQCIPLEPADRLPELMRLECEAQLTAGLRLVSSFTHDGHMFLVFKKT